ncbi:hypothetical protein MMPV_002473 [Pyropia vietnamensis]
MAFSTATPPLPTAAAFVTAVPKAIPTSRRGGTAACSGRPPLLRRGEFGVPATLDGGRRGRGVATSPARQAPAMRFRPLDDVDAGETPVAVTPPTAVAPVANKPPPATDEASPGWGVDVSRLTTSPAENLKGFIKTRGSLVPGEEFVFWWAGDIYGIPDSPAGGGGGGNARHLFAFEGYNIGRMVRVEGGWRLLTREVGVYRDPKTGALLSTWTNPFTGEVNEVVPVFNDPVNQEFLECHPQRGPFTVPTTVGGGDVYWSAEVFLNYPSPLPRADFPDMAQSDVYSSLEMFQFFGKEAQLADPTCPAASDVTISWVRLGQWLPFMRMGDTPGRIVYHTRGRRLAGGYNDLAADLRALVEAHDTKYASAPTAFSTPNETSWSYFRKWLARKGGARVDGTVAGPEPGVAALTGSLDAPAATEPVTTRTNSAPTPLKPTASAKPTTTATVGGTSTATPTASAAAAAASGRSPPVSADAGRTYTVEQLRAESGASPDAPLLVGLRGLVFDVSTARRHYGPGQPYAALTGRDATWSLVTGDIAGTSAAAAAASGGGAGGETPRLTAEQEVDLAGWVAFMTKTYPVVGTLV